MGERVVVVVVQFILNFVDILRFCFCFCGILASPSEVSQRGVMYLEFVIKC